MPDIDISSIIRKYALKNALDYGKASVNNVVGKAMGERPELRALIKAEWINTGQFGV